MGRLRHGVPAAVLLSLASVCASCGGSSSSTPPPPPVADFSLSLSSNSISITQGAASPAVTVSVNPVNGFSGAVQVALNALPAGVTSNPASPFSVAAGASTSVVFGASTNAATGNFMASVQGTSGTLSHSASLSVAIQSAVNPALPRTAYARTDSASAADDPLGEPHHRHIAYDPANKRVFIANRSLNRVDVFSTTSQSPNAQISIPGPTSADLSADGTTVWIGTALEQIVAVDTSSLRIRNRYLLAGLTPLPGMIFSRPVEVLPLSNSKSMLRLRQSVSPKALLALWDPASNSLTDLTSAAPALFQQGLGVLARSGDHSKVLAAANDSSGELALFDSESNILAGPRTLGTGLVTRIAANSDGSRLAAIFASSENTQLLLLDASLRQVGAYAPAIVRGVTFSRDGKYLYLSESSSGAFFVSVLDGNTAQLIGRVPDAAIQGVSSEIEDADETQLLFGLSNRGVSFVDAAAPASLPSTAPAIAAAPSLQPSEGPLAGGTSVVLSGQNFISPAQLKFGAQSAQNVTVSGPAQIQANSPPSVTNGAVNLSSYFQNGWLAIARDAFSYGPQILQLLPNAGTNAGGDLVQIYGYGFGSDPTKITVKIRGENAAVQKVEDVTDITASLGLDASYPFPLERITLRTPPGSSGKADVFVSTPSGSTMSSRSFQFLQSVQSYAKPGFFKFLLYDQNRQRIYLTNIDHIDVFDLQQNTFLAAPASRRPSPEYRIARAGADSRWFSAHRRRFRRSKCLSPRSRKGNWLNRARRRSSRLHQLWSRAGRRHKHANSLRRSQRRRRFFWRLFHMPRSDEPDGEPANHSAGSAAGGHRSDWCAACSGHCLGRSRFCCLRHRSRWPRRCLEREYTESVHHFRCQCFHNRSRSFLRRQHVCLSVKRHNRDTRRRS